MKLILERHIFDLEAEEAQLARSHRVRLGRSSRRLRRCEGSLDELGPDGSRYFRRAGVR